MPFSLSLLASFFSAVAFSSTGPSGAPWHHNYNDTVVDPRPVTVLYPSNRQQAIAMIQKYRALGKRIRIIGQKHSASSILLGDDAIYISTVDLKKIGPIESVKGETFITVEPGVELGTLSDYLASKNLSLGFAYPQYRGLTIGGVTATGSMGSSLIHTAVSSQNVVQIDLITAQTTNLSEVAVLKKGSGDVFSAAAVSLGSMGLVGALKLRVYPQFNLEMKTSVVEYSDLFRKAGEVTWSSANEPTPDTSMVAVFFNSGKVVRMEGRKTNEAAMPGAEFTPFGLGSGIIDSGLAANEALERAHNDLNIARAYEANRVKRFEAEPQFVTLNAEGQLIPSRRVVGPSGMMTLGRGQELRIPYIVNDFAFSFPNRDAYGVLKTIEEFAKLNNFNFPITGMYFRFAHSSPGSSLLSHMERQGQARELMVMGQFLEYKPWGPDNRAESEHDRLRDKLFELLMSKHKVKLHPGKNEDRLFEKAARLAEPNLNVERFARVLQKVDPEGVFSSDFLRTKILNKTGLCSVLLARGNQF